jgi:endonuclease G
LESLIRDIAIKEDSIIVITGPVFKENKHSIGTGVTVPGFYYKIVLDITDQKKTIGFLLPHAGSKKDLFEFSTTIDDIEQ